MEEEQKRWVPMFTEDGFEKTKIPPDLYEMLVWEYEKEIPNMYPEPFAKGGINAEEIVTNIKKAQSRIKNMGRTFSTNIRYCLWFTAERDRLKLKLLFLIQ